MSKHVAPDGLGRELKAAGNKLVLVCVRRHCDIAPAFSRPRVSSPAVNPLGARRCTRCVARGGRGAQRAVQALQRAAFVRRDFYADWCGPCKYVAPLLEAWAARNKEDVAVLKVDVDAGEDALRYGVSAMPTFKLFRGGKELQEVRGADMRSVEAMVARHRSAASGAGGAGGAAGAGGRAERAGKGAEAEAEARPKPKAASAADDKGWEEGLTEEERAKVQALAKATGVRPAVVLPVLRVAAWNAAAARAILQADLDSFRARTS
jgi:thiol-disulfide isomerase/thioredoxin